MILSKEFVKIIHYKILELTPNLFSFQTLNMFFQIQFGHMQKFIYYILKTYQLIKDFLVFKTLIFDLNNLKLVNF